jgi:hypothetical protein
MTSAGITTYAAIIRNHARSTPTTSRGHADITRNGRTSPVARRCATNAATDGPKLAGTMSEGTILPLTTIGRKSTQEMP